MSQKRKDPFKRATLGGTTSLDVEGEDDLLDTQEVFARGGIDPSATVVNPKRNQEPLQKKQRSLFAQRHAKKKDETKPEDSTSLVMSGAVIERDTSNFVPQPIAPPIAVNHGFPSLNPNVNLARKFQIKDNQKDVQMSMNKEEDEVVTSVGDADQDAIDHDSDRLLSNMTEEEIRSERDHLLSQLDPVLIERLRQLGISKKKKKTFVKPEEELRIKEVIEGNSLEEEKRKWMDETYIQPPSQPELSNLPRYDFDGLVIDSTKDYSSQSGLYHHGLEPDRPGYTVVEIVQLIRSTLPGQRSLNMELLSRIINNYKKEHGYRKYVNELLSTLTSKYEILDALLSIGLVDRNVTSLHAALLLLYALISNEDDEKMFERYEETINMSAEKENDDDLLDKLYKADLFDKLAIAVERSSGVQDSARIDEVIIKILHYFARHSLTMAQNVLKIKGLFPALCKRYLTGFIPKAGVLLIELMRHLSMQGPSIFSQCDQHVDLIQLFRRNVTMLHQLSLENKPYNAYVPVCIELLRLMRTVAFYEDRTGQEIADSLTQIMRIIGLPLFLIGSNADERLISQSMELSAAGCDLLSNVRLHGGHMREFIENDVSRLIRKISTIRTAQARYLCARALHMCASVYERVSATEDHQNHLVESINRVHLFTSKFLTPIISSKWIDESIRILNELDSGEGSSAAESYEGPLYFAHYEQGEHYNFDRETAIDSLYSVAHISFTIANVTGKLTNELVTRITSITSVIINNLNGLLSRDRIRRRISKLFRFFVLRRYMRPAIYVLQSTRFGEILDKHTLVQLGLYSIAALLPGRVRGDLASAHWIARNIVLNENMYDGVRLHRLSQFILLDVFPEVEEQQVPSYNLQHGVMQSNDAEIDWIYSGIECAYTSDRLNEDQKEDEAMVALVSQNLEFICALEPQGYIQVIPFIIRFANMTKVFMIENEIFFREEVRKPLQKWIDAFATRNDISSILDGLATNQREMMSGRFFSMFERLAEHYMAVSYHDRTFASYLLVFFARLDKWESKYRLHIMNEVAQHQLVKLFENNAYTVIGTESDDKVILAYIDRYLSDEHVDTTTSLYRYTTEQVASYLFASVQVDFLRQNVWSDLFSKVKRTDVLTDILSTSCNISDQLKHQTWISFWTSQSDNRYAIAQSAANVRTKLPWIILE
jgi:hypothetical protein